MTSGAYHPVFGTVRGLIDNIDKGLRADFHIGERASRHTPGTVKNKNNIRRVERNIRSGRKSKRHLQGSFTIYLSYMNLFV